MGDVFFYFLKKIIISALFIYAFDSLIPFSCHVISINYFTVFFVSYFGFIAMFYLVLFSFI